MNVMNLDLTGGNRKVINFGTDRAIRFSLNAQGGVIVECYDRMPERADLDDEDPRHFMALRTPLKPFLATVSVTLDVTGMVMSMDEGAAVAWLSKGGVTLADFLKASVGVGPTGSGLSRGVVLKAVVKPGLDTTGHKLTNDPTRGSSKWVGSDDESTDEVVRNVVAGRLDDTPQWIRFDENRYVCVTQDGEELLVQGYEHGPDGVVADAYHLRCGKRCYTVNVTVTSTYTVTVAASSEDEAKQFFVDGGYTMQSALENCSDVQHDFYGIYESDVDVTDHDDDWQGADVDVDDE